MADLGNVWHLRANPEPRGRSGMVDPVFPTFPVDAVTVTTGNQYAGGGNPGNQLQVGSSVYFRRSGDAGWTALPLGFVIAIDNNKYYSAAIPVAGMSVGTSIDYYFAIAYDDHDLTFVQLGGDGTTSVTTADQATAQAGPFTFTIDSTAVRGRWGPLFDLPNVGIHAHVLPTLEVLMWGRRDDPNQSLDVDPAGPIHVGSPPAPPATCTPFLFDFRTGVTRPTPTPTRGDPARTPANLFCAGHSFLPDGRLLVAGGHLADGAGLDQTTVYDPGLNTWSPSSSMVHGRWYPTLTSLPDGSQLITSGSFRDPSGAMLNNVVPELWAGAAVTEVEPNPGGALDLYPRLHVESSGEVVVTGSLVQTWTLDPRNGGTWTALAAQRLNGQRDYGSSVLYDDDRMLYVGGGSPPTANAEVLDLTAADPLWAATSPMTYARRQHNATILADGTVLVTGGTRGGGPTGAPENFNNLDPGQPVHVAERWDPATGAWTELAAEATDRCYHATAVLLPDGTVLSAGGGEFFPVEGTPEENDPLDTHRDAQVFTPPYLFAGDRPVVSSAPSAVTYGQTFPVGIDEPATIVGVSWIGLSSVTHSFNTGQRFSRLSFQVSPGGLDVTAPADANSCPPGHYLLFLLNSAGVPSVAEVVQISSPVGILPAPGPDRRDLTLTPRQRTGPVPDVLAQRAAMLAAASGTRVVVGLTGTCPYGIAACWGGANEALRRLEHVDSVDPVPDGENSTAAVFLDSAGLPPLTRWREQFRRIVHDSYELRGFEVELHGTVESRADALVLAAAGARPAVRLAALGPGGKVQWSRQSRAPEPVSAAEASAYATLVAHGRSDQPVVITGPLEETDGDYRLRVRRWTT